MFYLANEKDTYFQFFHHFQIRFTVYFPLSICILGEEAVNFVDFENSFPFVSITFFGKKKEKKRNFAEKNKICSVHWNCTQKLFNLRRWNLISDYLSFYTSFFFFYFWTQYIHIMMSKVFWPNIFYFYIMKKLSENQLLRKHEISEFHSKMSFSFS